MLFSHFLVLPWFIILKCEEVFLHIFLKFTGEFSSHLNWAQTFIKKKTVIIEKAISELTIHPSKIYFTILPDTHECITTLAFSLFSVVFNHHCDHSYLVLTHNAYYLVFCLNLFSLKTLLSHNIDSLWFPIHLSP